MVSRRPAPQDRRTGIAGPCPERRWTNPACAGTARGFQRSLRRAHGLMRSEKEDVTSHDATRASAAGSERRIIPFELIEDARKHVYEAAVRTPLVRLNYSEAPCEVLVMDTAPATKLDAIRRLGAEIVKAPFDQCWKALGDRRHPAMSGTFVHPFEDDEFIAGNASAGLEILEDLPDVDSVVAAFGGGGLSCGIACAMQARKPGVKVFAAEPETASPLARSFAMGSAQDFPDWKASWVDGCGGKSVFPRMWALAHHALAGSVVVTLEEIRRAMKLVAERNHVIAEGAGACAVAAALSGKCGGGKVVAVVSGGNIDLSKFLELVSVA